jgi:citrate lyase subunit beta/citryl-CoA lyase
VSERWEPPGPAILFCPADRPDRFAKAAAAADAVILDLEDGVAPGDKPSARLALQQTVLDPATTIVRINPAGTPDHERDLAALDGTAYEQVMLAKAESAPQVQALLPRRVIPLIETPAGVIAANELAAAGAGAMMWGAEDLIAGLGGRSSRHADGRFRDVARHARSVVLLAASAAGISAIDSVFLDIHDYAGLAVQAVDAAGSGFAAVACIHPSQVGVVRDAFRPTQEEVQWARRVLAAATDAAGVFALDGRMVDAPVLNHAQRVLDQST